MLCSSVRKMKAQSLGATAIARGNCLAALATGYRPYRYHAMVTSVTPRITVKVAAVASVNSQSIAFHHHSAWR